MLDHGAPDAITDAVAGRLLARLAGPLAELDLERVPLLFDPPRELPAVLRPGRRLGIAGVEFTQSTQHHGAAGPSYGADNSVSLVAAKPLVARVYPYVRAGLASDSLAGSRVTGELILSSGNRVVYRTGPTRPEGARVGARGELVRALWDEELNGLIPGPDLAAIVRPVRWNPPLNFSIPAWHCGRGRFVIAVRLWRVPEDDSAFPQDQATASDHIEFIDVPAPRVCLVRVNWTRASGTVSTPTDVDMLATLGLAERMLPFPYFETTILDVEKSSSAAFAMVAATGGCNAAWNALLTDLALTGIFTALFGLGDIVIGMVPAAAIPPGTQRINAGCGNAGGVAGCFVGFDTTLAHELGHIYGRRHVAVPGDGDNDPDYPNYGGDARSIGEVGVDTGSAATAFDPTSTIDIMAYQPPPEQWISPYTYQRILDARGAHQSAPADHMRPLGILAVRLHRDGRVDLRTALRVDAPGGVSRALGEATSPLSIDLLDGEGAILATHHCLHRPSSAAGCCSDPAVPAGREPHLDLHEVVEWQDGTAALAFHRGEATLAAVEVGEAPTIELDVPRRHEGRLIVSVRAGHPRATPALVVLFSADDGETWRPVAVDVTDGEISIREARLPGGERCRVRVIATAELRPAVAETEPFGVDRSPRRLYVLAPDDGCVLRPGAVALRAVVDDRGHGVLSGQDVHWRSSIDGELGEGLNLRTELGEGRHELTVTAPDGLGGRLSERAIIIVSGRGA